MDVTYTISEDDYVNASKLAVRPSAKWILIWAGIFALVSLVALQGDFFHTLIVTLPIAVGLVAGAVTLLFMRLIVCPYFARRHYRKYPLMHAPMKFQVNESGFCVSGNFGESKIDWKSILKWRQNGTYLVIFIMPAMYYIVPKSIGALGFDIAGLIEKLQEKVGKEK